METRKEAAEVNEGKFGGKVGDKGGGEGGDENPGGESAPVMATSSALAGMRASREEERGPSS